MFKSRRRYRFPFTFVVPEQLLPQACSHETCNDDLRLAHLQLPPSLGDPMLASDGTSLLDDMAPEMTQISYLIRVSVKKIPSDGSSPRTITAVAKKVRIIPASVEQPPLEIPCKSDDYCVRKEKDVRRGLLRGKMGRLVMAASQPRPLQLRPPGAEPSDNNSAASSSVVTVHLRFDPEGNELPPPLGTLYSKLKVSTFFGTTPWTEYPSKSPLLAWNPSRGVYTETVPLSTLCVSSAQWERQSSSGPSGGKDKVFYTASIIVPVSLPKGKKTFVPTFHSCLISRVYSLDLSVSYHTPNANVLAPSVSLKVPIQITSAHRKAIPDELLVTDLLADITISQMQVDEEFFRPRSIAPYPQRNSCAELTSSSSTTYDNSASDPLLQPPEYSLLPNSRPLPERATAGGIDYADGGESSSSSSSIGDIPANQTIRTCC